MLSADVVILSFAAAVDLLVLVTLRTIRSRKTRAARSAARMTLAMRHYCECSSAEPDTPADDCSSDRTPRGFVTPGGTSLASSET